MSHTSSSTPVSLDFPVPSFDFAGCDAKRWNDGSAVKSHFWNAFSSLLPNIEFCAIRHLLPVIKTIDDDKLRMETQQFCGQEGEHGKTHSTFNVLKLHGPYPLLVAIEAWERRVFTFLAKVLPSSVLMSMFVAVEHLTAAFSHFGLRNSSDWFSNCDPTMFKLWEWHAVEELAHKSVCFDIYRYFGGGYFLQILGMFMMLLILVPGIFLRLGHMFWKDAILFKPSSYVALCSYLLSRKGVLTCIATDFLRYFSPRYRPWSLDSRELITAWEREAKA